MRHRDSCYHKNMAQHKSAARRVVHWRAPEFIYREKTLLWYTNVSVFFLLVLAALFAINNYVGVAIVILAAWVFLANSNDRPRTIEYSIDRKGIKLGERMIPFSDISAFSIMLYPRHPILQLDLTYPLSLPVTVVVKPKDFDTVANILLDYIPLKRASRVLTWISRVLHY